MIWIALVAAIAIVALVLLWRRGLSVDRSPAEVAKYLRNFIEGTGDRWDWDDFESVAIKDAALERIRSQAVDAGPPNADLAKLRALLAEAEELARR